MQLGNTLWLQAVEAHGSRTTRRLLRKWRHPGALDLDCDRPLEKRDGQHKVMLAFKIQ